MSEHAIPDEECLPRFFIGEDLAEEIDDERMRRLTDEARAEEFQRDLRINSERAREIVTIEGDKARARADAWARSPIGTPYGGTEVVPDAPRSGTVHVLDQRRMAELLGRKVDR